MFSVVEGKRKWYCDCASSLLGVYAALAVPRERRCANGRDLAREGRVHLEEIRVRVDVDDLAEARMRRRAVVALEEVLHHDLPVRLDRPLVMGVEADRVDVEPALRHDRGQPAECRLERRRVGVGVHEDERAPGAHRDGREREARGVEARLTLRAGRSPQGSVQVVRPRVVRALERLAAPGPLDDEVSSVAADVDQPAKRSVRAADDGDRDVPDLRREVRPGLGDPLRRPRVRPGAREEPLALALEDAGIGVPARRERPSVLERVLELGDRCRHVGHAHACS